MLVELVTPGVRIAVRNAVGGSGLYVLRDIRDLFARHGFTSTQTVEDIGGERRTLAESIQAAIDWTSPDSEERYSALIGDVLEDLEREGLTDGREAVKLRRELARAGMASGGGGRAGPSLSGPVPRPEPAERHWGEGPEPRVFLSHIHTHRTAVGGLADQLRRYGVKCFVAHQDIEPSLPWQAVIQSALRTCDCLVAYVTRGFRESQWCDQEVGWALGRGIPTIPIRAGADPHGLLGSYQGIPFRDGMSDPSFAEAILRALATAVFHGDWSEGGRLRPAVVSALVESFAQSGSFDTARARFPLIEMIPADSWNDDLRQRARDACQNNGQLREAVLVAPGRDPVPIPDALEALLARVSGAVSR